MPIPRTFSVRVTDNNRGKYPAISIKFIESHDGHGFEGITSYWIDGKTQTAETHKISIRQGSPLGKIFIFLDLNGYGCAAQAEFEGVGITERDLQWAAQWAVQAMKIK